MIAPVSVASLRGRRLRIAVVAWDMGHNGVIRAYYAAEMLSRKHDVELVGVNFRSFGTEIWEPIRDGRLRMRAFPGRALPQFVDDAERFTRDMRPDLVYVSRARLPSLLIGMLIKHRSGVPVIVDIDDLEFSFYGSGDGTGLALDALAALRDERGFRVSHGELWTRACHELIADADAVTVSNEVLQGIYGGTVLLQVRDERTFNRALYDRGTLRADLGFSPRDRVIMFIGTPKRHKGVTRIVDALTQLADPAYKLCIVGSIPDDDLRAQLHASPFVTVVGSRPVSEIPPLVTVGDLVCVPQDPDSAIARHQTPGKLTEALAMAVPVLAESVAPLAPFIAAGLVTPIGETPLARQIAALFADPDAMVATARRGRQFFLRRMSYAAGCRTFDDVVAGLDLDRRELPARWLKAYRLARDGG